MLRRRQADARRSLAPDSWSLVDSECNVVDVATWQGLRLI
jgi:hypothetical protein